MVRELYFCSSNDWRDLVIIDGKASTDGIRRALGMFDRRFDLSRLTVSVSYGTRDGR